MKYTLVILLLLSTIMQAQRPTGSLKKLDGTEITPKQIDLIAEKWITYGNVEGLAISIINGNKAYIKPYGLKNAAAKELLHAETVMYAASFSKAVFAYLIMKLVESGQIDLDKPLHQYLDKPIADYDNFKALENDDRWKLITPRMCLAHTTGLPNLRWLDSITGIENDDAPMQLYSDPGSKYAYSGEGLKLLQLAAETVTGKNIEQLAAELVFIPFGMMHTGFIWHPEFDTDYAVGHDEEGKILTKQKKTVPNAAGSMVTSIVDYTKFIQKILLNKGLDPKLRNEMISPQIAIHSKYQFPTMCAETTTENDRIELSYALGWGYFKCKFGRAFFKEGHDDGWRHYNVNFPDKNIAIIIMTNSANGESIFKDLLYKLIADDCTPWQWERYVPFNHIKK